MSIHSRMTAPLWKQPKIQVAGMAGIAVLLLAVLVASLLLHTVSEGQKAKSTPILGQGYWHTHGTQILDANNQPVRIAGVNWFGFETTDYVAHGLQYRSYKSILDQIKSLGYNTLRLPYSNQFFDAGSMPHIINYTLNPDLRGLHGLPLLDKIVNYASSIGLHIILDQHRPDAVAQSALWYTDAYPETRWIADWKMLATHYNNNPMVLGADLHNEPHAPACWGCGNVAVDWQLAAQRAGDAILASNPHWLIFVEGVNCYNANGPRATNAIPAPDDPCYWWGGNLEGVSTHPVQLSVPDRLVYSVHDYPASVFPDAWFSAPNYPANLTGVWDHYWGFVYKQGIAPVWISEFGTMLETDKDKQWFSSLVNYIKVGQLSWTFWTFNPDSGDTGGILYDDWKTVVAAKQKVLQTIQFPLGGKTTVLPTPGSAAIPIPTQKAISTPQTPKTTTSKKVTLQALYKSGNPGTTTVKQIMPYFEIANTGTSPIQLNDITIRYWYTLNDQQQQHYTCDYAQLGCNNIEGRFVPLSTPRTKANSYLEISFSEQTGSLAPGTNTGAIQNRFNKNDWSNFNENEDYSYIASNDAYTPSNKITVYYKGVLIWGSEPL
ncbi:MAG TPA: cellulase family glycosylhydrolase [Ktedonobacteraceae bacterium]